MTKPTKETMETIPVGVLMVALCGLAVILSVVFTSREPSAHRDMAARDGVIYPLVMRESDRVTFLVEPDGTIVSRGKVLGKEPALAAALLVTVRTDDLIAHGVNFAGAESTAIMLSVRSGDREPANVRIGTVRGPLPEGPPDMGALKKYLGPQGATVR